MNELNIIINNYKADNNNISHAYLINTDDLYDRSDIINFIKNLLIETYGNGDKLSNIFELIDNNNFSDLKVITPNGNFIKKEQILSLQDEFKTKSYFGGKRFYIIEFAENLNNYSFNSLLKFLEEPENDIVAFLISKNINKIAPTIISRCQIINLKHSFINEINSNCILNTEKFLSTFFVNKNKSIAYLNDFYILSNNDFIDILKNVIIIFNNLILKNNCDLGISFDLISQINSINYDIIIKYIYIIDKYIDLFNKNFNYKLLIDNLIIELNEVK